MATAVTARAAVAVALLLLLCSGTNAQTDYRIVGRGYCYDYKYLATPYGNYPPLLPSSSPLYSPDRIQECRNRCLDAAKTDASYSTKGFYVGTSTNPDRCGCAKCGQDCSQQSGASSGYDSYAITNHQGSSGWWLALGRVRTETLMCSLTGVRCLYVCCH